MAWVGEANEEGQEVGEKDIPALTGMGSEHEELCTHSFCNADCKEGNTF